QVYERFVEVAVGVGVVRGDVGEDVTGRGAIRDFVGEEGVSHVGEGESSFTHGSGHHLRRLLNPVHVVNLEVEHLRLGDVQDDLRVIQSLGARVVRVLGVGGHGDGANRVDTNGVACCGNLTLVVTVDDTSED